MGVPPTVSVSDGGVDPEKRLNCWKDIAAELGVGVRAAQLYESTRGLPVQRDGKRVSITLGALRKWQSDRFSGAVPLPAPVRPLARWRVPAVLVLLGVAASAAYYFTRSDSNQQPAAIKWNDAILTAFSRDETPLWRYAFPYPTLPAPEDRTPPWIGDIDGDGSSEVVTLYPHVRREEEGWELFCFSSQGKLRWRLGVHREIASSQRTFLPPYVLRDFVCFPSPERDGTAWVAAVFVHHVLSPAVLVVVDSAGRTRGELWQDGHLNMVRALDLDRDGVSEILAGGIQEIPAQAALLIVDPRSVAGAARSELAFSPRQFVNLGPGTEQATVYFPRTGLNRIVDPFNFVKRLEIVNGRIQASVVEHIAEPQGYLVYSLTPQLTVEDIVVSDSLILAARRANTGPGSYPSTPAAVHEMKNRVRVVRWND